VAWENRNTDFPFQVLGINFDIALNFEENLQLKGANLQIQLHFTSLCLIIHIMLDDIIHSLMHSSILRRILALWFFSGFFFFLDFQNIFFQGFPTFSA
jgi:hypothetical protein